MSKSNKWNYGNAIERYPINEGETWSLEDGRGKLRTHDLYQPLPDFMLEADLLIIDPPWNLSNVNTFYTKADMQGKHLNNFHEFYQQIFRQIDAIGTDTVYIEMGKQNVDRFEYALSERYQIVERYPITYYNVNPCFFLRASNIMESPYDYTGMDEWNAILLALEIEDYHTVADFVIGRGLVAVGAYRTGHIFAGTDLNKKRLAVVAEKIAKMGGAWEIKA